MKQGPLPIRFISLFCGLCRGNSSWVARLRASRPFCMKHALLGAAQLATVVVGANHPAYGQCTQSSPCASLTKLGTLGGVASGVTLPEDLLFGAHATSSDGSVVVGGSLTPHKGIHPFRWTSATGTVDLGTLQAGTADVVPTSRALYISSNGSVVAGIESDPDSTTRVFRWTSATGMIDLGTLGKPPVKHPRHEQRWLRHRGIQRYSHTQPPRIPMGQCDRLDGPRHVGGTNFSPSA